MAAETVKKKKSTGKVMQWTNFLYIHKHQVCLDRSLADAATLFQFPLQSYSKSCWIGVQIWGACIWLQNIHTDSWDAEFVVDQPELLAWWTKGSILVSSNQKSFPPLDLEGSHMFGDFSFFLFICHSSIKYLVVGPCEQS